MSRPMSGPRPWGGEIWEARIRTEPELPLREAAYGAFRVLRGKRGWRYVTHQALTEPELHDLRRRSGFVLDHPFWIFQLLRKERMVGVL